MKTDGVVEVLRRALAGRASTIEVAFIYGSFAQAAELVGSDLDLMIVGSIGLSELAPALRSVEKAAVREVNPVVFSGTEVRKKLDRGDHFLTSVVTAKKIFCLVLEVTWQRPLTENIIKNHSTSKSEIESIFALVERDLADAALPGLSADRSFAISYNAAQQLSQAVVAC